MISDRSGQVSVRFSRSFGCSPLRQFFRISLLIMALASFIGLSVGQDQGSSAPSKGQEPPSGGRRPAKRRWSVRRSQEERRAPTPSTAGEAKKD